MTKDNEEIIVRPNRGFKALALGAVATVAGATVSQAALTVDPTTIYSGVEGAFDAAALIGVAIVGVMFTIKFVKKGLRA